jgi:hypothetical protein
MSSFLYELPTTGAVSFVDFCSDSTGAYTLQLAEATQARANVRAALKESKRTDGEKDNLGLVKVRALAWNYARITRSTDDISYIHRYLMTIYLISSRSQHVLSKANYYSRPHPVSRIHVSSSYRFRFTNTKSSAGELHYLPPQSLLYLPLPESQCRRCLQNLRSRF